MKSKLYQSIIITLILILFIENNHYAQNKFYINKAGENFIEGDVEKAILILEFVLKEDSNNERAYFNLGNFNTAAGNFDAAIKNYLKAAELYPKHDEPLSDIVGFYPKYYESIDNLALAYLVIGNYAEAIKLTEESSMPGYDSGQPIRTSYLAHILNKDFTEGVRLFTKYKSQVQNTSQIINDSLLVALFTANKLTENGFLSYLKSSLTTVSPVKALEYLKPALNEIPDNQIFLELNKLYSDPDYLDKRTEDLESNNEFLKAKSFIQNSDFKAASDIVDDLLDDDPDNLSYLELQALVKFSLGKPDEAITVSRRMIELNPSAAVIWYNIGYYYFNIDSLEQAESCLLKSLELSPEYPEANAFLGDIVWYRDRNYIKAKKYYEREIEINPKNENTYFNFAKMCFQNENYEDAIKYLSKLISINPHDLEARTRLIDMYVANNDKEKALSFTEECLTFLLNNNEYN
jgi:tetratricopeptide (TPR) repeat protein